MPLNDHITTFGQEMLSRYGERIHKLSIHAGFTCPNRDGSKGVGGCTFCNNSSFSPNARSHAPISDQIASGRSVLAKRTGAKKFIAYFQAYTNTYDNPEHLRQLYDEALAIPDVIGLSIGTRPDCVPDPVLEILAQYRERGFEVWLELGLQSSHDQTLERVNRGHTFAEYCQAVARVHRYQLQLCTHLIVGLPGEGVEENITSLERVLEQGVEGLKLHPLHVVKGTQLANSWRQEEYQPWSLKGYISTVADMVERTPPEVIYHRLTGTASNDILLAPQWCQWKWRVLNGIEQELKQRGSIQGIKT
ncbi:MAG: TIGR01212 family radical SAM protein [Gammaproteobacteria bacterium]|nr:TIGR01212 family radical SAM protein [Gammaproteobacteria bacterium]